MDMVVLETEVVNDGNQISFITQKDNLTRFHTNTITIYTNFRLVKNARTGESDVVGSCILKPDLDYILVADDLRTMVNTEFGLEFVSRKDRRISPFLHLVYGDTKDTIINIFEYFIQEYFENET